MVDAVCKKSAASAPTDAVSLEIHPRSWHGTSGDRRYVIAGHAWHSSAVTEVESGIPDLNRTTASAVEQKLFVPDDLVMGVATIT